MSHFKLSRRKMLRGIAGGTSVAVGLPLLEAMVNSSGTALAHGGDLPVRFLMYYWADGIVIDRFEPTQVGPTWDVSELMAPLAPYKDYLNVCTGLANRFSGGAITHHEGMTVFNGYNFQHIGGLSTNAGGPTVDQRIADALEGTTTIRSTQVRVSKRESTDGDGGTTVLALSHRGEPGNLTALVPQFNPRDVWQTLFGEFVPKPDDRDLRTSILDHVKDDAADLKKSLGMSDRNRLDKHLEGVFELEAKILATPPTCALPELPSETNTDSGGQEPISSVNTTMAELIAYAFTCDITRVASFLFKKFVSATVFDEIDAGQIHHSSSHQGPGNAVYAAGIEYSMQKFADLLGVFANTEELDETNLLDSTIIYASTDCSTGASHSIERQPIILAGHGRGYLAYPGIHYQATPWNGSHFDPNATGNTADVLLTCLQAFDPAAGSVGSGDAGSTTPLIDVLA